MWEDIELQFPKLADRFRAETRELAGDWALSLRCVREQTTSLEVRRDVPQPPVMRDDWGGMLSIHGGRTTPYAATSDLSDRGLEAALERLLHWWRAQPEPSASTARPPAAVGSYRSPVAQDPDALPLSERIGLLRGVGEVLGADPQIVDWSASLWSAVTESLRLDSRGGRIEQRFDALLPNLQATAYRAGESQSRSLAGAAHARQAGLELLEEIAFSEQAARLRDEALELLSAPNCPNGSFDLLLAPDQMILQIHESIGHPLELDRILGDERNYAGTSFVTPEMFGSYQYGSSLLNVSFDPSVPGELGSYAFDDHGSPAEARRLIEAGLLLRPLGGELSQERAGLGGVANARASSWNRPPIDRMANLNLEAGDSSFEDLVAGIDDGFYFETNCSWSIDHERNKFQFGCERGRRIREGRLAEVVKNPNYRGTSSSFWRNLDGVGDAASWQVLGTPTCGKGEPNQAIRVGHASPPCRFRQVQVFGGAE